MQSGDHAVDFFFTNSIFLEQFAQETAFAEATAVRPAMWKLFHLDRVLVDFAFSVEGKIGTSFVDRHDSQIDFRSKPSIQLDLALAKMLALFQRTEIEKAKIDGLLHFEDE